MIFAAGESILAFLSGWLSRRGCLVLVPGCLGSESKSSFLYNDYTIIFVLDLGSTLHYTCLYRLDNERSALISVSQNIPFPKMNWNPTPLNQNGIIAFIS